MSELDVLSRSALSAWFNGTDTSDHSDALYSAAYTRQATAAAAASLTCWRADCSMGSAQHLAVCRAHYSASECVLCCRAEDTMLPSRPSTPCPSLGPSPPAGARQAIAAAAAAAVAVAAAAAAAAAAA